MLEEAGHIRNTIASILRHIQCLHLMHSEGSWVLASSGNASSVQLILDPDYLPYYLFVSDDYDFMYQDT